MNANNEMLSSKGSSHSKQVQIQEVLQKSEARCELLKELNESTKKSLENEIRKNAEQQQEISSLKQQLFKANQEKKDLEVKLNQQKIHSESLVHQLGYLWDNHFCLHCKRPLVHQPHHSQSMSSTNLKQKHQPQHSQEQSILGISEQMFHSLSPSRQNHFKGNYLHPHINHQFFSAVGSLNSSIAQSPPSQTKTEKSDNRLYLTSDKKHPSVNVHSQHRNHNDRFRMDTSVSSQSSLVSDEDNAAFYSSYKYPPKIQSFAVSAKFNQEKGSDLLRQISRYIVARNYDSNISDHPEDSTARSKEGDSTMPLGDLISLPNETSTPVRGQELRRASSLGDLENKGNNNLQQKEQQLSVREIIAQIVKEETSQKGEPKLQILVNSSGEENNNINNSNVLLDNQLLESNSGSQEQGIIASQDGQLSKQFQSEETETKVDKPKNKEKESQELETQLSSGIPSDILEESSKKQETNNEQTQTLSNPDNPINQTEQKKMNSCDKEISFAVKRRAAHQKTVAESQPGMQIKFQRKATRSRSMLKDENINIVNSIEHRNNIDSESTANEKVTNQVDEKDTDNLAEQPLVLLVKRKSIITQVIQEKNEEYTEKSKGKAPSIDKIEEKELKIIEEEQFNTPSDRQTKTNLDIKTPLFEKFLILGCEKEDMKEFDADQNCTQALLPGKVLYAHPPFLESEQESSLNAIAEFALPNGIVSEKFKVSSSFRRITDLILENSKSMIQSKFYMFTMKNQNYFDSLNTPSSTEDNLDNVLQEINPHRLLYCFCFKTSDYLETTTNEKSFLIENRTSRIFWESKKVYCFVSFFPFHELFQEMLMNVRNQIKISRAQMFNELEKSNSKVYQELDGDCVKEIIKTHMLKTLEEQRSIQVTGFQQMLSIETLAGQFSYVVGQKKSIIQQTHRWSVPLTCSNMCLQDLLFIFHAILFENTVIFNSRSKSLLTQTIHTFEQLIYPFNWPHPIIYLLPETLNTLFDSPVPIIMGVNKCSKAFYSESMLAKYQDHIFVDLDHHRIFCSNPSIPKAIIKQAPNLNNLQTKLSKIYTQINSQGLIAKKPRIYSTIVLAEKAKQEEDFRLKYITSKTDDQVSEMILTLFNESLHQSCVKILENKKHRSFYLQDDVVDYQAFAKYICECGSKQDSQFLNQFVKTQIFTYFFENNYTFD